MAIYCLFIVQMFQSLFAMRQVSPTELFSYLCATFVLPQMGTKGTDILPAIFFCYIAEKLSVLE